METSGEVGERESLLSVVTILVHKFAPHIDGDANEDCAVHTRWIRTWIQQLFILDCAVEAG